VTQTIPEGLEAVYNGPSLTNGKSTQISRNKRLFDGFLNFMSGKNTKVLYLPTTIHHVRR